jgi:hypothetical protein
MTTATARPDRTTAAERLAELRANVDAWYADAITYDEFGRRNVATWDAIHARGERFTDRVLALWRSETYGRA